MAVVNRDARTTGIDASRISAEQLGLLSGIFEHAVQCRDHAFADQLVNAIARIAQEDRRFKKRLRLALKGAGPGATEVPRSELLRILLDHIDARRDRGLSEEGATAFLAVKLSKPEATVRDWVSKARKAFPGMNTVAVIKAGDRNGN